MSQRTNKDPQQLLKAFYNMLYDHFEDDDDEVEAVESPPSAPAPAGHQQAGLAFEVATEREPAEKEIPIAMPPYTGPGPWDDYDIQKATGVNLTVPPELYRKMSWLRDNVPKLSFLKLTRMGLEAEVERLIALHYRPEA